MRRTSRLFILLLLLTLPSPAVWTQDSPGSPKAARGQTQSAADPLQGRWTGTVKSPQGGEMPAVIVLRKEAESYSGSISDFQPNRPMIPFQTANYDPKQKQLATTFALRLPNRRPTLVNITFVLDGETLRGKTTVRLEGQPPMQPVQLVYELKKISDYAETVTGPSADQPEMDEYNQIRSEQDPTAKKKRIDDFLQAHPNSNITAYVLQEGALLGRSLSDIQMLSDYGERSLAVWPDNFVLLTELGSAYVQRRLIDRGEERATKAIALIDKAEKPLQLSETQWAAGKKELLTTNFSTLGFVHTYRAELSKDPAGKKAEAEKAIAPFKRALELTATDDFSLYGLGFVYGVLNDYPNAESNLAKCAVLTGSVASAAKSLLEDFYKKQHNGSLDGLDQVMAKARSELGIPQ